jgi:hypothetical protein
MDDFSDQEKSKNQNYASYLNLVYTKTWIDSYTTFLFYPNQMENLIWIEGDRSLQSLFYLHFEYFIYRFSYTRYGTILMKRFFLFFFQLKCSMCIFDNSIYGSSLYLKSLFRIFRITFIMKFIIEKRIFNII